MPFTRTIGDTIYHFIYPEGGDEPILVKEERRELNPRHAKERAA